MFFLSLFKALLNELREILGSILFLLNPSVGRFLLSLFVLMLFSLHLPFFFFFLLLLLNLFSFFVASSPYFIIHLNSHAFARTTIEETICCAIDPRKLLLNCKKTIKGEKSDHNIHWLIISSYKKFKRNGFINPFK